MNALHLMMRRCRYAATIAVLTAAAGLGLPGAARAQDDPIDLELNGLFRTGLRLEGVSTGSPDADPTSGFDIYDARLGLGGKIGLIFDYDASIEWDGDRNSIRLLDARLGATLVPDYLKLDVGQMRAPFGYETLLNKADIQFVDRAQVSNAIDPAWQLGFDLSGTALETRLSYWGGMFNGDGRTLENDDSSFMYALRAQFNNIGDVTFYEDFVVQVGANLAFSKDSALEILPVIAPAQVGGYAVPRYEEFSGDRLLWGADLKIEYRAFFLAAEYAHGQYDRSADPPPGPTPPPFDPKPTSDGYFIEGGYSFIGAVDLLLRWDDLKPAETRNTSIERSRFVVAGINLYPGFFAKIGFQYAFGIDDTKLGFRPNLGNVGTPLADKQFMINLQVSF
jgi:phosphate-selective porin